ncbi:HDOD domain-containing protein [Thioalkalivibrio sp.]|uniref:HDOD domain-containing protein n=1 Tax=Thioalkalivibrio sp. TaxID=2093813 RepID=UPI003563EB09
MAEARKARESLPSLPQVLVRILDAIYEDQADLQKLSAIILQDAAMTARVIAVANSSFYYRGRRQESLDRAVLHLGTDAVKTLVMTASMRQLFSRFGRRSPRLLKRVWRNALVTASLSQVLAVLTSYPRPEEAYLSGLMVDIGRLVRLGEDPERYRAMLTEAGDEQALIRTEREVFGSTHCEVAADLMEQWGLSPFIADAVRYHLEPAIRIRDAHHLVKIVNLGYSMGRPGAIGHDTLVAGDTLFGLNEGLTAELRGRVSDDVTGIARSLGIDIEAEDDASDRQARQSLGERLEGLNQLARLQGELSRIATLHRHVAVQRALLLTFGVQHSLVFLADDGAEFLKAWIDEDPEPAFLLPLERGRSVVADAVLEGRPVQVTAADGEELPVVDRQILGACGAESMWVQPFPPDTGRPGALVLGLNSEQLSQLAERGSLVAAMGREIAAALGSAQELGRPDTEALERRIREMVHEAGNPLSIIQNYLAMLRVKLGEEHDAQLEIGVIRDEIERVGRILMRMREAPREAEAASVSLNREVQQITDIFAASVCSARGIELEVELASGDPPLAQSPDHLRQILTNLLKNATEAIGENGKIKVTTRDPVSLGGRRYTEIIIQDDGPGLPPEVQARLFSPVQSTKGDGHSGLGLSIVKRLVDEMDGVILCSSGAEGTRFQVLLPRAAGE